MSASALYRQPVLLDRSQHRGLRVRREVGLEVAATMNACFVAVGEFAEVAKEYVIAFVASAAENGQDAAAVSPIALLGLRDSENLYVDAAGHWDARYVPAFVRRYPLGYAQTGEGQQSVMIDAGWAGFGDPQGELLVNDDGTPAPFLQEMMRFLDAYEEDVQRTRALCQRIVALGLLKPVQIDITLPEGQTFNAGGVQMIDEARLKALPDAAVLELMRSGALGLLHAQLISSTNLTRLTDRLGQRVAAPGAAA
jgi:hypothetical protein